MFATIAELGGLMNWKSFIPTTTPIDSKSFLPLIKNQLLATRTWIFTEQFNTPAIMADGKTIRNENYHLIRFDNGNEALYNQTIDTEENVNLLSGTMSVTDIANYHFLCDSLTALVGSGTCEPLLANTISTNEEVILFPNPVTNQLEINCVQNILSVKIFDAMGRQVHESNRKTIQLPNLTNGLYFIEIQMMDKERYRKRILLNNY